MVFILSKIKLFRFRRRRLLLFIIAVCTVGYLLVPDQKPTDINDDVMEFRLNRYMRYQEKTPGLGPGQEGTAVILTEEEQMFADNMMANATFNVVASNKMALDRSIPDTRKKE